MSMNEAKGSLVNDRGVIIRRIVEGDASQEINIGAVLQCSMLWVSRKLTMRLAQCSG